MIPVIAKSLNEVYDTNRMHGAKLNKLKRKILFLFPLAFILLAVMLFLPAGTLNYWQGWLFIFVILSSAMVVLIYFYKRSPDFLERRLMYKEKETKQQAIIKAAGIIFLVEFLIPGFDYRFGWSQVPVWLVIFSNLMLLLGYYIVFLTFKENAYAGRTVEVYQGQKVIDTGPYALVRHPMYAGALLMYFFMPLALGSYWAALFFIPEFVIIIFRALNEEEVLKRDLSGYKAYCKKVRFRFVPHVW